MNKLPPTAAGVLEQARRADREHQIDVERTLAALHGSLPFADADLPALPGEAGANAATRLHPGGVATGASTKLWFGTKAAKLFLAAVVAGTLGGSVLWGFSAGERAASRVTGAGAEPRQHAATQPGAANGTSATPAEPDRNIAATDAHSVEPGASAIAAEIDTAGAAARSAQHAPTAHAVPRAAARVTGHRTSLARPTRARHARAAQAQPAHPAAGAREDGHAGSHDVADRPGAPGAAQSALAAPQNAPAKAAPSLQPPTPMAAPPDSELDLIDAALASLREGRGERALSLLEAHRARYPQGKFSAERQGLRVVALCALGRLDEGRAARAAFLRSVHDAPIVARVQRACEADERGR